ncbi:uncharacterized protein C9orf85 homolog isoform X2 [Hydra vulgaris]|uniref:Uncharacterized protein C9orf85 homolog isoform X2 n=1 Tax=Hydra vulgaris TaxID=6087 RepID=A0ABM4D9Q7_HYDVU
MSSQRGNVVKKKGPKHKNEFAFKNDLHDTTGKMKAINNLSVSNVCQRCKDCIEWKIKYKKYKPLTVPGKCVRCFNRNVKFAYHIVCSQCVTENSCCAKCNKNADLVGTLVQDVSDQQKEESLLEEELKHMRLREKKAFLRQVEKEKSLGCKNSICLTKTNKSSENESDEISDYEND